MPGILLDVLNGENNIMHLTDMCGKNYTALKIILVHTKSSSSVATMMTMIMIMLSTMTKVQLT